MEIFSTINSHTKYSNNSFFSFVMNNSIRPRSQDLRMVLERIIQRYNKDPNMKLEEFSRDGLKDSYPFFFITANYGNFNDFNMDSKYKLRNYNLPSASGGTSQCTLIETMMVTMSNRDAHGSLEPVIINGLSYYNGGIGGSNPTELMINESKDLNVDISSINFVLSLGT